MMTKCLEMLSIIIIILTWNNILIYILLFDFAFVLTIPNENLLSYLFFPYSPNILDSVLQYDLSMGKPSEISGKVL